MSHRAHFESDGNGGFRVTTKALIYAFITMITVAIVPSVASIATARATVNNLKEDVRELKTEMNSKFKDLDVSLTDFGTQVQSFDIRLSSHIARDEGIVIGKDSK